MDTGQIIEVLKRIEHLDDLENDAIQEAITKLKAMKGLVEELEWRATHFKFNLNNNIIFKPNKMGKMVYMCHWLPYCRKGEKVRKLELNDQGFAQLQLYDFMHIFGPHLQAGSNIPIETTVFLHDKNAEVLFKIKEEQTLAQAKGEALDK